MALPPLWDHQRSALKLVERSGFSSGVVAHATGTGKSRTAWEIVSSFGRRHQGRIIIWVCERSSVLRDLFKQEWVHRGLTILNLVEGKDHEWPWKAIAATCWRRPVLVIVTRAYLISKERYRNLRGNSLGLVVHDECHSGAAGTMRLFFEWVDKTQNMAQVIGLSATPPQDARIISRFSIYDAMCKGVILPMKLVWGRGMSDQDLGARACLDLAMRNNIRKIIVWCGTIHHAHVALRTWTSHIGRDRYLMAIDTSRSDAECYGYEDFKGCSGSAVLFCAAKHREGSDIPGLGMAVFVDGVPKRGAGVFVQCVGRVLRRGEGSISHGIVVDLGAQDGLELCDRVGKYLRLPQDCHPWIQSSVMTSGGRVHTLTLHDASVESERKSISHEDPIPEIETAFVRPVPDSDEHRQRVSRELDLIKSKGLEPHLYRAVEVLRLAGSDVEHVTRGSCGSSLVCYLLGISHVDPVKHRISFARFLNEFRDNLPDIDYDFPHNRRNEIFMSIAQRWPGKVARISNHVHFHERSALREALRRCGLRGAVPNSEFNRYISKLDPKTKSTVERCARELDGAFNCYSLHCGGIVYYPEGVPNEDILESRRGHMLAQVKADKRAASKDGQFKIDILSSRALAQLVYVTDRCGVKLSLETPPFTSAMRDLFARGDNIGLTLAESPLSRAEHRARKPASVEDVAACMALIRPAARQSEIEIVYDDDAIKLISESAGVEEGEADKIRRKLAKCDPEALELLKRRMPPEKAESLQKSLGSLSMYGFCKAHAMSYAQLVCWLAWCKTEHPKLFWQGALKHCNSFYKPWVHVWESHKAGVHAENARPEGSVFAQARRRNLKKNTMMGQLRKSWQWNPKDGFPGECYIRRDALGEVDAFRGVIACSRRLSDESVAITIGTADEYFDVTVPLGNLNGASRFAKGSKVTGEWLCVFN